MLANWCGLIYLKGLLCLGGGKLTESHSSCNCFWQNHLVNFVLETVNRGKIVEGLWYWNLISFIFCKSKQYPWTYWISDSRLVRKNSDRNRFDLFQTAKKNNIGNIGMSAEKVQEINSVSGMTSKWFGDATEKLKFSETSLLPEIQTSSWWFMMRLQTIAEDGVRHKTFVETMMQYYQGSVTLRCVSGWIIFIEAESRDLSISSLRCAKRLVHHQICFSSFLQGRKTSPEIANKCDGVQTQNKIKLNETSGLLSFSSLCQCEQHKLSGEGILQHSLLLVRVGRKDAFSNSHVLFFLFWYFVTMSCKLWKVLENTNKQREEKERNTNNSVKRGQNEISANKSFLHLLPHTHKHGITILCKSVTW